MAKILHANEGVPSDIKFTSAATNDSFMLRPAALHKGDIMAMFSEADWNRVSISTIEK